MRNYLKLFTIISFALLIGLSGCKKDEGNEPMTNRDYLISGSWKVTGTVLDPGIELQPGIIITDVFEVLVDACAKDDFMTFNSNGTITEDQGATKCDPDDPQTNSDGTWTLSEDGSTLTITTPPEFEGDDPDVTVVTIVSINSTTFVGSSSETIDLGDGPIWTGKVTVTMTLI
jgi:hypothetical protein